MSKETRDLLDPVFWAFMLSFVLWQDRVNNKVQGRFNTTQKLLAALILFNVVMFIFEVGQRLL